MIMLLWFPYQSFEMGSLFEGTVAMESKSDCADMYKRHMTRLGQANLISRFCGEYSKALSTIYSKIFQADDDNGKSFSLNLGPNMVETSPPVTAIPPLEVRRIVHSGPPL